MDDCLNCGECESCIDRTIAAAEEAEMADQWWLHVPCNDRHGNMLKPCDVDMIAVYIGHEHVLTATGMEVGFRLAHEDGDRKLKFYGLGRFPYQREWSHVGNILWNAYAMEPADVCHLLTRLRDLYHWRAEHAWVRVYEAMALEVGETLPPPITPDVFTTNAAR